MKKLMIAALGLSLLTGSVVFAQDSTSTETTKKKKKGKKKKDTTDTTSTAAPKQ
jgi:hypothetical protein